MVTVDFLQSQPADTVNIPVASRHDPVGYYPGKYLVAWNGSAREWRVALAGFLEATQ